MIVLSYNNMRRRFFYLQFVIEDDGVSRRAVYYMVGGQMVDPFSYEMLRENYIEGVLAPLCMEKDGMDGVCYDISNLEYLSKLLSTDLSMEQILAIFLGIIQMVQSLKSYLLDTSYLITDLEQIYFDSNRQQVFMIYLPTGDDRIISATQFDEKIFNLFKEIIFSAKFVSGAGNYCITELLNGLNNIKDFSLAEFYLVIENVRRNPGLHLKERYEGRMKEPVSVMTTEKKDCDTKEKCENVLADSGVREYDTGSFDDLPEEKEDKSLFGFIRSIFGKKDSKDVRTYKDYDSYEVGSPEAENLCVKEGFGNYGAVSEAQDSMNNVSANNISEPDDGETMVLLDGKNGNTNPYIERKTSGEKVYITKRCMCIGKDKRYADYIISDNAAISRAHARLLYHDDRVYVVDEDSLNHTYVNEEKLLSQEEKEVVDGDVIIFADEEFVFHC